MPSPTYTNPGIAAVVQDQQLERLNFATGLRQDPAGYSQFQQQNIKAIVDDITNRKQSAFQKAQIDLGRYMDMHHNVNFYKTRSGDVDNITNVILANNQKIEDLITQDKINSRRQFEINEWYNYNKLETLFLLQIVFMASLAAAIVMYLTKKGMITVGLAGVLYGLLGLSVLFTGLYKYFYTEGARDVKLWHRRRFQSTPAPPPPPSCPTGTGAQAVDDAMAAAMALELSAENCGSNINQGLTNITMGAANQLAAMQSGQTNLIQQLSSTGSAALGAVCGSGQ